MRRCSLTALIMLTLVASLFVATGGAQALVVNDAGTFAGVSIVPTWPGTCAAYEPP